MLFSLTMKASRWASRLAAATCILAVSLGLAAMAIAIMLDRAHFYEPLESWPEVAIDMLLALAFSLVGALIALKRPGNLVGWALLMPGVALFLEAALLSYAELALFARPEAALPAGEIAAAVGSGAWPAVTGGVFALLLLFPDGVVPSRRWRLIAPLVLLDFALIWFLISTNPELDPPFQDFENPLALANDAAYMDVLFLVLVPPCVIAVVAAAIQLIVRARRSSGDERERFKWLRFSATFLLLTLPLAVFGNWEGLLALPFVLALMSLPAAVGIAVFRYRLYDIDIIINRTLVYAPLTAILAGLFVAMHTLLRTLLTNLANAGSDLAIAFSTLAVVALLTPVKNKLQVLVDRHFKEERDPLRGLKQLEAQAQSGIWVLDFGRFTEAVLRELIAGTDAKGAFAELDDGREIRIGEPGDDGPIEEVLMQDGRRWGRLLVWPGSANNQNEHGAAVAQAAKVLSPVGAALVRPPLPILQD